MIFSLYQLNRGAILSACERGRSLTLQALHAPDWKEICQAGMKTFLHALSVLWDQLTQARLISVSFASSCCGNLEVTIQKLGKWRTILTSVSECDTQGHWFPHIFLQAPQQPASQHSLAFFLNARKGAQSEFFSSCFSPRLFYNKMYIPAMPW